MKIAMIGSGAAGSVFAAYLKRGGAELYLVDRYKAHMDKIAQDGLLLRELGKEYKLTGFHTSDSAENIGTMDAVILMVKCTQTENIMPTVMPCIGKETVVISLQNGLLNEEILSRFVEKERLILGFGKIGTELPEPGVCVAKPESGTAMYFGPAKESELSRKVGRELEKCFIAGGCNASYEVNIKDYIWRKAVSNCGYNAVSAVLRLPVGPILRSEQGNSIVQQVWKECSQVAEAMGVPGIWAEMEQERERLLVGFADYYSSMAQDVLHQRQTEIEHMNGAIVRFGKEHGIATPVNELLTNMVITIQKNY
jgi:2-dehydropantoate 2-reductase